MRSPLVVSLLSAVATLAGGCIVVDNSSGGHSNGAGVAATPTGAPVYRILPGASTVVSPGQQAGYGITANVGGSYRLVDTGDSNQSGTYREFYGSVYTTGTFSNVVPGCNGGVCPLESSDSISGIISTSSGQRIDFDFITADGLDGFDFVASEEPVYFDLYIDGTHNEQLVFFPATDNGGTVSTVQSIPFGLTTQ